MIACIFDIVCRATGATMPLTWFGEKYQSLWLTRRCKAEGDKADNTPSSAFYRVTSQVAINLLMDSRV
jgi:hypothetical protein